MLLRKRKRQHLQTPWTADVPEDAGRDKSMRGAGFHRHACKIELGLDEEACFILLGSGAFFGCFGVGF